MVRDVFLLRGLDKGTIIDCPDQRGRLIVVSHAIDDGKAEVVRQSVLPVTRYETKRP